jgi:predicted amidohydrolase
MSGASQRVTIALANLRHPASPEEAVELAVHGVREAGRRGALVVAFPECFVPGYRIPGQAAPPPDKAFLERAWARVADAAREAKVAVVLGTERVTEQGLHASVAVIGPDGTLLGFQDKVQIDPSEEGTYTPGAGRRVFTVGPLTFGIAICHEGWRYPETVRFAARDGAQVIFHPHFHPPEPAGYHPKTYGDPANSFHEKAVLCRAAENTCYFATINAAAQGSPTTSAVAAPDGTLLAAQPYGVEGLLVVELDLSQATGLLARRLRPV